MALETATSIADLVSSNPLSSDDVGQGDDHLRLIKAVLKAQFPGAGLQGYNTPIVATEQDLNFCTGISSNVQTQINTLAASITAINNNDALIAPVGTKMIFAQASAPAGWVQDTSAMMDNAMMRIVDSAGGGAGGSDSPILYNHTHVVEGTVLTEAQLAAHSHFTVGSGAAVVMNDTNPILSAIDTGSTGQDYTLRGTSAAATLAPSEEVGSGDTHDHTLTALSAGDQFTPKYIDVIVCTKS